MGVKGSIFISKLGVIQSLVVPVVIHTGKVRSVLLLFIYFFLYFNILEYRLTTETLIHY